MGLDISPTTDPICSCNTPLGPRNSLLLLRQPDPQTPSQSRAMHAYIITWASLLAGAANLIAVRPPRFHSGLGSWIISQFEALISQMYRCVGMTWWNIFYTDFHKMNLIHYSSMKIEAIGKFPILWNTLLSSFHQRLLQFMTMLLGARIHEFLRRLRRSVPKEEKAPPHKELDIIMLYGARTI